MVGSGGLAFEAEYFFVVKVEVGLSEFVQAVLRVAEKVQKGDEQRNMRRQGPGVGVFGAFEALDFRVEKLLGAGFYGQQHVEIPQEQRADLVAVVEAVVGQNAIVLVAVADTPAMVGVEKGAVGLGAELVVPGFVPGDELLEAAFDVVGIVFEIVFAADELQQQGFEGDVGAQGLEITLEAASGVARVADQAAEILRLGVAAGSFALLFGGAVFQRQAEFAVDIVVAFANLVGVERGQDSQVRQVFDFPEAGPVVAGRAVGAMVTQQLGVFVGRVDEVLHRALVEAEKIGRQRPDEAPGLAGTRAAKRVFHANLRRHIVRIGVSSYSE